MKKRFIISILILATAFLLSLGGVGAALTMDPPDAVDIREPNISISVLPAQQRLELDPGETKTAEVTVSNSGNVGYEVKVYATPYTVTHDYANNVFEGEGLVYSQIYRWIKFDGNEYVMFRLEPGERREVEFTIDVPDSVPAGGQYAGIMAEIAPPPDAAGIVPVRRIASLLFTNINGHTIDKGEITGRGWQGFYSGRDIETSLTVDNLGNTDFAVQNRMIITGLFGGHVDEVVMPPKTILPGTSRTFELNWTSRSSVGIYRLTQQTKFLDQEITESRIIFIMPIWFIGLVIIVVTVVIVATVALIRKRRRQRKMRRA